MPIKIDGTNSNILLRAGTSNTTTLTSALAATPWTFTLPPNPGIAGQVLTTDGLGTTSWTSSGGGGGGSPGGLNTQIQFNNSGAFGGSAGFTFDGSSVVSVGSALTSNGTIRLFNSGTANAISIRPPSDAQNYTLTLPSNPGTAGQFLTTDGTGNLSWSAGGGGGAITVADDTTTNATRYPLYSNITTGTLSTAYVASTEYTFNPASGTLTAPHVAASAAIFLNAQNITANYTIPAGMNGLSAGPINTGTFTVTVPSGQTWKVV